MRSRRSVVVITIGLAALAVLFIQPIGLTAARQVPHCVAPCESVQLFDRVPVMQATGGPTTTVGVTVQPTLTLATGSPITHTVKAGETFNAIAKRFNLTPSELSALNQLTNTSRLEVGQVLIVGILADTPTLTSTPQPTLTALPTAAATAALTGSLTEVLPTRPAPASTDVGPTLTPAASVPIRVEAPNSSGVPIDVYLVAGLMVLAVIGIIIGFKTQNR